MSTESNYEPILPPLPKPLQSSKYWDRGIEWALAGERAVRLEREDQLRESLAESLRLKAEVERIREETIQECANLVEASDPYDGRYSIASAIRSLSAAKEERDEKLDKETHQGN